jgi:hypothetical protein
VSTPIRAWRLIFTKNLLDKIVRYTNDYGEAKSKEWSDITRKGLEHFIAILFVTSIQKRKDKPSNWFSENKLIGCPLVKKIMSGRKFLTILRYLHVCELKEQDPNDESYDPAYKVAEFRDYLERRYTALFIPGQELSLDETLIRAFGRIKFKVRIVSKAARYGIKVYVITDARTAYVLRVLIYTGRTTYTQTGEVNDHPMKTVQIVNKLVAPFIGTHRTIYIDRFYTSTELIISLAEKDLYVTGTLLANRIPLNIRIPKASQQFQSMKRGDAVRSKFIFCKADGTESSVGLVGWKDRNMVYCISNDANNFEFDECCRRGEDGIIRIPRPIAIANYNKFMGGVDLADMIRLSSDSTIMYTHRWWLKPFFYLLDVATANAMILHNECLRMRAEENGTECKKVNIAKFKMSVIEELLGGSVDALFDTSIVNPMEEHVCVAIQGKHGRHRCAYCALMSSRCSRTRFQCKACGVPLCSVGNGRAQNDCFTEAHETEERRTMVLKKYHEMQKRTNGLAGKN